LKFNRNFFPNSLFSEHCVTHALIFLSLNISAIAEVNVSLMMPLFLDSGIIQNVQNVSG